MNINQLSVIQESFNFDVVRWCQSALDRGQQRKEHSQYHYAYADRSDHAYPVDESFHGMCDFIVA